VVELDSTVLLAGVLALGDAVVDGLAVSEGLLVEAVPSPTNLNCRL
jgi:hypothetical protein